MTTLYPFVIDWLQNFQTPSGSGVRWTGFVVLAVFFFMTQLWRRRINWKGLDLPGPRQYFLGRFVNLLECANTKRLIPVFNKWCRENGPAFRLSIGPMDAVVLNSAPYVQKVYGSLDINHLGKTASYEVLKPAPWFDGLISSKGQKWKGRRKLLSHIVEYKSLKGYTTILNQEGSRLCSRLKTHFADQRPKEIQSLLYYSALTCVSEASLGEGLYVDDNPSIVGFDEFIHVTNRFMEIGGIRGTNPFLYFNPIWRLHPLAREQDKILEVAKRYVVGLIERYKQRQGEDNGNKVEEKGDDGGLGKGKRKSLLENLIDEGLPFQGIFEEVLTMIVAGYDTTGITLHLLLFLLALNPEHQELCREEVDMIMSDPDLCPNGDIPSAAILELKHLDRCISETLRLFPVIFIMMRKLEAPVKLDTDLELPIGTNVILFTQGIHLNPDYFPNPSKFDPYRFLPEETKARHPYAFVPFSAGPRKCIGYKFAMMELHILGAKILRNFTIRTKDKLENLAFLPEITLTPEKPMLFEFEQRTDI